MKIVDDLKNNLTIFTIIKKIVQQELYFKEEDVFKPCPNFTVRFSNLLTSELTYGVYTKDTALHTGLKTPKSLNIALKLYKFLLYSVILQIMSESILRDPGAVSRVDYMFVVKV